MDLLNTFASLFSNFGNLTWQMVVMWGIGALLPTTRQGLHIGRQDYARRTVPDNA